MSKLLNSTAVASVVALTMMSAPLWAEDGSAQFQTESKATSPIKQAQAVRSGRAGTLEQLQRDYLARHPEWGTQAGEINQIKRPADLLQRNRFNIDDSNNPANAKLISSFSPALAAPAVNISAEGYSSDDNAAIIGGRVTPPDTNGDVGLNHYVQYVNLGWVVLNKANGSVAAGPFVGNLFWQGFGGVCESQNAGDPIVLYDHLAGRWLFSQFTGTSINDGHQCVAISDGEDPTGPYTLYDFVVSPNAFNDYPKLTVWPDGYYMTTHEFAGPQLSFAGVNLTVFDRAEMLAGNPNAGFIQFTGLTSPGDALEFGAEVGHLEGFDLPPAGTCNHVVHATDTAAFGLPGSDRFRFWQACVDFANPNNSTLVQLPGINVPAFDQNFCGFSRSCIEQNSATNNRLDALAGFTMYRFNQRYFPAEGVLKSVATTNVDVGGDRAGVLWAGFDINPATSSINIGDGGNLLGVVDFNDGLNRWMGSASLDQNGNIGIGYTLAGNGKFPSIYFTVHERGVDGAGQVQAESSCVDGSGSTEGANRWADYASTSVDPLDGCTFWHTNEYVETTGNFQWNTRVCSFAIPSCGGGGPINIPPTASFTANCTDLSCSFDATASNDADGSIVSYAWSFGDGASASGVTTGHTYGAGGTFNVTLTVTDDQGATGTATQSVTVNDPNATPISLSTSVTFGRQPRVTLTWSGASSNKVDILRNGSIIRTTNNDGSYNDRPGSGTFTYQVCEENTSICSNTSTETL
ncbi:MAG: hypothetical protein Tsb002_22280 [Wenzhouxiangellaceae bacterium]